MFEKYQMPIVDKSDCDSNYNHASVSTNQMKNITTEKPESKINEIK